MDYSAIGQTVHLAARMEQLAMPGSILLTPATLRLVEGYVDVNPLGVCAGEGIAGTHRDLRAAAGWAGAYSFAGRRGGARLNPLRGA